MKATLLTIPEVVLIEPQVFGDDRGFFFESFNQAKFESAIGRQVQFVQDNHSRSSKNVLRGLHYQIQHPHQGKLVRVVQGSVFDVTANLRKSTRTFGQWGCEILPAENKRQLWSPECFEHDFVVLSDTDEVLNKTTDYYAPAFERCILWNDETVAIDWPAGIQSLPSANDAEGKPFVESEVFA